MARPRNLPLAGSDRIARSPAAAALLSTRSSGSPAMPSRAHRAGPRVQSVPNPLHVGLHTGSYDAFSKINVPSRSLRAALFLDQVEEILLVMDSHLLIDVAQMRGNGAARKHEVFLDARA